MKLKFRYIFLFLFFANIFSYRDPFSFKDSNQKINKLVIPKIKQKIEVLALLKNQDKKGAILKNNEQTEVIFIGDNIWGYKVAYIDNESVTLINSKEKKIKLFYEYKD